MDERCELALLWVASMFALEPNSRLEASNACQRERANRRHLPALLPHLTSFPHPGGCVHRLSVVWLVGQPADPPHHVLPAGLLREADRLPRQLVPAGQQERQGTTCALRRCAGAGHHSLHYLCRHSLSFPFPHQPAGSTGRCSLSSSVASKSSTTATWRAAMVCEMK